MILRRYINRWFLFALETVIVIACLQSTAWAAEENLAEKFLGPRMPYTAFDQLPATELKVAGATFKIAYAPGELTVAQTTALDWVRKSAEAIAAYFGRFPVASVRILIVPVPADGVHASSWGHRGAAIRVRLNHRATDQEVSTSWVMTHEMVHLAFPEIPDEQMWLDEGLATYIEPIARAQLGQLTIEEVWRGFLMGMPKGLPKAGDQGLDNTHTWGRTYWGGALFCLLADIDIRQRTKNTKSLRDASWAIVKQGGNKEHEWPLDRVIEVGDKATGVPVLRELYERMKAAPVDVDLPALWTKLGVALEGNSVRFDDSAPLAAVRKAITTP